MLDAQTQRDSEDRLAVLVDRLARTQAELEELVKGQADAVIDPVRGGVLLMREAQTALQESEARYRRLVTHLSALVFEIAPDGTVLFVNQPVVSVTGYDRDSLLGRNWWELFFHDDAERQRAAQLRRLLQSGDVSGYEISVTLGEQRRLELELSTANRYAKGGRLERIVAFALDITERKRAQERLRQAAVVFESTTNAVMVTDAERRIVAVNGAFTKITGFTAQEAIGGNPRMNRSGRHDEQFYQSMWKSIAETGLWQGEIWNRRRNGEVYPAWENISTVTDEQGRTVNYVAVFSDISAIKESAAKLDYLAHHDPLTDLANRLLFFARLDSTLERAKRHKERLALLFLDLDRFKVINDVHGHEVGDRLLQEVAGRMKASIRAEDTLARLGGDEFVVIMNNPNDPSDAAMLAEKIIDAIGEPVVIDAHELRISMTIGISIFPDDAQDGMELVRSADTAMYSAKQKGRSTYQFSTAELNRKAIERSEMESALRAAIARDEITVEYQPRVSLVHGRIVGAEALARWHHPGLGAVPPERFIPIAEDIGIIDDIGEWVLRTACDQARVWRDAGFEPFLLSVNLSGRQALRERVVAEVRDALRASGINPCELELEVTESMLQSEQGMNELQRVHALGVRIAIDDFGSGYSSFSQLKRLPVDTLKIDASFIQDVPGAPRGEAIVAAIIAMGHSMAITVVAEGVENQAQLRFLRERDCDELQGDLFSKALAPDEMLRLLESGRQLTMID